MARISRKADAQQRHAINRARLPERAGLELTTEDYQWLTNCIRKQDRKDGRWARVSFVGRQSLRVTIWDILLPDRTLRAVYDKTRGRMVTFLPRPVE
jgi:hypothetical protein